MRDDWTKGVKNCPNLHYVIYGQPLRQYCLFFVAGVTTKILAYLRCAASTGQTFSTLRSGASKRSKIIWQHGKYLSVIWQHGKYLLGLISRRK